MRRAVFIALFLLAVSLVPVPVARAQGWAKAKLARSPRHGEYVTLTSADGRTLQAWVVYPQASHKTAVIVMVHEIFGLTDWAREMADELAAAGYIVVEPDLLSGLGPEAAEGAADGAAFADASPGGTAAFPDQDSAVRAVSSLPDARVLANLDAAADYGAHLPAANGKLFVTGFCWGGGKSFLFATHRHDLSAAFVFYGPPPLPGLLKDITAPVYGFYAGNDERITATIPATKDAMKADGKLYEPVVYPGAGHGFMRAGEAPDASAANAAAREAALHRMMGFLRAQH